MADNKNNPFVQTPYQLQTLKDVPTGLGIVYLIIYFFWQLVWVYALYLSFKCNNGFSFVGFLGACCCSPCYVAYKSSFCK